MKRLIPTLALGMALFVVGCVKTTIIDNPEGPPEGEEIVYECIWRAPEVERQSRWREMHPYDVYEADRLAREKCQRFSVNPSACYRDTCQWILKEPAPRLINAPGTTPAKP